MKKVVYILLIFISCIGCEMPPSHLFGIHFHAHRLNIYNQYADASLSVRSYSLGQRCDICAIDTVYSKNYNYRDTLLYNESTYELFEVPIDFEIKLVLHDTTIDSNAWYIHIDPGEKNKHTDIILE